MNDYWTRYGIFILCIILISAGYIWRCHKLIKEHQQELGRAELEGYNRGVRIYRDGARKVQKVKWASENILPDFMDILDQHIGKYDDIFGKSIMPECIADVLNKYDEIFGTYIDGFRQGWDNGYTYGWNDSQSEDPMANFRRELAEAAVQLEAVKEADEALRADRLRVLAELDKMKKRVEELESENG